MVSMDQPDVNVLVGAFRNELPFHDECRGWFRRVWTGATPFGVSELALSGFLRVVTNPRVFDEPTPLAAAMDFARELREHPRAVVIAPGPRHWRIFEELCAASNAKGNLIPDAYFAALAIESGSVWVTLDGDYRRFPGLRFRRPGD